MKVYVVTTGTYSDYSIHSIHSTPERARFFAERLYNSNDVEEWEVDDISPAAFPRDKRPYYVIFDTEGCVLSVGESTMNDWLDPSDVDRTSVYLFEVGQSAGRLQVSLWARDEAHARKAAQDRRAQWLAEQANIT